MTHRSQKNNRLDKKPVKNRRSSKDASLTRRKFTVGAAGTAATLIAASYGLTTACSNDNEEEQPEEVFPVDPNAVDSISMMDYEATANSATLVSSYTLPTGALIWVNDPHYAAALIRTEQARPLSVIAALDLASGEINTVIEESLTDPLAYELFDVRIGENVIAWVELNYETSDWVVYAAPFSGVVDLEQAIKLEEGDIEMSPPDLMVWKDQAFWTSMPNPTGERRRESSRLNAVNVSTGKKRIVLTSPGRLAIPPTMSQGVITAVPRVEDSGTRYKIEAYNVDAGDAVLDTIVLPRSIRPYSATYLAKGFAFSIEANYGFGGIFGSMGTYIGSSTGPFLSVSREPYAEVTKQGNKYAVKNQASTLVFDPDAQQYYRLPAPDNSLDYGDYPASVGINENYYTYTMVSNPSTGIPSSTLLRAFKL